MQRYFSDKKIDNNFILSSSDMHHIKKVMRIHDGDKIEVVYKEKLNICKLNNDKIEFIKEEESNISGKNIILLVPVLKESKMDFILQKATELGASKIIPIVYRYSNINYKGKEDQKQIRWNKICREASRQCKRLKVPEVLPITKLKDTEFLDGVKIVCSTKEKEKTLKKVLKSNCKCDTLYIGFGPEGGLEQEEEEYLKQKGFISVTLGDLVLRTETVPLFVLSTIKYEYME